jgi:hypothetical protein
LYFIWPLWAFSIVRITFVITPLVTCSVSFEFRHLIIPLVFCIVCSSSASYNYFDIIYLIWFGLIGLWCSTPLSTIFQFYRGMSFIGGGNRRSLRKPHACRKLLASLVTKCCIEYTSPWMGFELTALVVIGTDCKGSKSNSRPRRPLKRFWLACLESCLLSISIFRHHDTFLELTILNNKVCLKNTNI